jgi:hypothetical protein
MPFSGVLAKPAPERRWIYAADPARVSRTEGQTTMMTESNLAKKVLEHLRQVPNATPAKLLAEFKRLVADDLKAKRR